MTSPELTRKPVKHKRMVPLRYVLMPFAFILAAIVVLVAFMLLAPKPMKKPIVIKAPLVEVMDLSAVNKTFRIASQGTVVPRTETSLIAEVSGVVTHVADKFVVGGFFHKGETLLTIDDISYRVALLQAKSRLDTAKASLLDEQAKAEQAKQDWMQTGKPLAKAPVLALRQPQLQKARAELVAAQAGVEEAQLKLAKTVIKAPYDAMLKTKKVDIGQYVTTGSLMAVTFAVDYAEVRLPIKQQDIDFLTLPNINASHTNEAPVALSMNRNGNISHWASYLSRYEGEIDTNSRVLYVVAKIDDPYHLLNSSTAKPLRIGSFIEAQVTGKTLPNVYAIPRKAVHGMNTLYLVDSKNQLHIQQVKVLHTDHDYLYSQDPLPTDMRLILTKLETPVETMPLRVVGESAPELAIKHDVSKTHAVKGEL